MKRYWMLVTGLVIGLTACNKPEAPTAMDGGINFTVVDLNGREVSLAQFRGKTVLLNIWATWCKPCIREIPDLKAVHEDLKDQGVVVLGVLLESGSPEEARPLVEQQLQINYPVWYGDDAFARLFKVEAFPTTVIIDRTGKVSQVMLGAQTKERFVDALKRAGI